jgi:hypothetical protein
VEQVLVTYEVTKIALTPGTCKNWNYSPINPLIVLCVSMIVM